jgi:hypothetical protein
MGAETPNSCQGSACLAAFDMEARFAIDSRELARLDQ